MIWGKTNYEQTQAEKYRDKNYFLLFPRRLNNGRWCWLQKVERYIVCTTWDGIEYGYRLRGSVETEDE